MRGVLRSAERRHALLHVVVWLALIASAASLPSRAVAQGEWDSEPELIGDGLELTINAQKDVYLRFLLWAQVWGRAMQMGPGTVVDGSEREWQIDIMLRRARLMTYAQLTDRFLILLHFGINNQTFTNGGPAGDGFRPQLFFHDVWLEGRAYEQYLYIGAGLIYWNGISRMTSASTLNFLALDAPILNWPLVDLNDQFVRQLGVYAKGDIRSFHYRIAVSRPFLRDTGDFREPSEAMPVATLNAFANSWSIQGYFNYNFFDEESHFLPYFVGTYLGTKKVMNVGAGFYWQSDAVVSCTTSQVDGECPAPNRKTSDLTMIGVDFFADIPIRESAFATYLVYYYYDMGPDFVRNIGIANLAVGGGNSGPGNSYPSIGTGNHLYWQAAYLLPFRPKGEHKMTPFVTLQTSFLEALADPSVISEVGFKYYFVGHHASVGVVWRNRPVFGFGEVDSATGQTVFVPTRNQEGRGNDVIVQVMIWL